MVLFGDIDLLLVSIWFLFLGSLGFIGGLEKLVRYLRKGFEGS
jgi:hypothetical protein